MPTTRERVDLRNQLADLAWRWSRHLAGLGPQDAPTGRYENHDQGHDVELAVLQVLTVMAQELAQEMDTTSWWAGANGASYEEIAEAACLPVEAARDRWPTAVSRLDRGQASGDTVGGEDDRIRVETSPGALQAQADLTLRPTAAALARRVVHDALQGWSASSQAIEDAQLVTSELVANALRYGGSRLALSVALDGRDVVITITDGSPELPQVRTPDPWAERGRGLPIVDQVANVWGVREHGGGKQVWARLAVQSLPAHRAGRRPSSIGRRVHR